MGSIECVPVCMYMYVCTYVCTLQAQESENNSILFSFIVTLRRVFQCCGACPASELLDLLVSVSPTLGSREHAAA